MEQRTEEWHRARLGKVTASKISDVMSKGRGNAPSRTRANYAAQLVCEILTDQPTEHFTNDAMQWGTDTEPQARMAYEFLNDVVVEEVGFVDHPTVKSSGASPDGLIGEKGLIEIKCPNTATHIETVEKGEPDRKYILQMQWQMACTGRSWCDFVSYDPRLPEWARMYTIRIVRDNDLIAEIEAEVRKLHDEVTQKIEALQGRMVARPEAA